MKRGLLPNIMIVLITVMGLVNFFAPFFTEYSTDPLVTYFFLFIAGSIAGYQGVVSLILDRLRAVPRGQDITVERKESE